MLPRLEHLSPTPGTSLLVRAFEVPAFPFAWHVHPEAELTLVTHARGRRYVGDSVADFAPGDLVLLGPNLPHTWHSDLPSDPSTPPQPARSVVAQFPVDLLGHDGMALPELQPVARLLTRAGFGLQITGATAVRLAGRMGDLVELPPLGRLVGLVSILQEIALSRDVVPLSGRAFASPPRPEDARRIDRVFKLIHARARDDDLRQEDAARAVHMSPASFSRFFRHATGRTFGQYLHELRVSHACRLLQDTDRPVTDICFAAGFGNLSNFNRIFLRLKGMTPRQFRARFSG